MIHVVVVGCLAGFVASWAALVGYGDNVLEAYQHAECNSTFYNDVQEIRDASQGLFVGGIFTLAFGALGVVHKVWSSTLIAEVPLILGAASIILAGLLAFLVGLSGSCQYAVGGDGNGEIQDLQVFGAFVLCIGIGGALLTDVKREDDKYIVASTTPAQFALWIVSVVVTA